MSLQIYNTLTRKVEKFIPIKDKTIGMYVCGPTVYGPSHLGHARTYVAFDVTRRYLEFKGYEVKHICNITDIHDDIIKEANKQEISIYELANKFIPLYLKDMKKLNVKLASVYPKVTEHIKEIIETVKKLEEKGYAYKASDGSVYFDISKFRNYGKLAGIDVKENVTGTRVNTDKYEKNQADDFVLWKAWKKGEPYWDSPWGKGRPGWHIECSVMSQKYLGETFDIHGGALDLIFPHHENEIAQSEAATGKKFVNYWMHSGLLTINGEKMSKSLGNYIEIPQILKKYDSTVLRLFFLSSHYRSPVDFNESALDAIVNSLRKIVEIFSFRTGQFKKTSSDKNYINLFTETMDDDFNTPKALAVMWKMLKSNLTLDIKYATLMEIDKVFGLETEQLIKSKSQIISVKAQKLLADRNEARRLQKWDKADYLRIELGKLGIDVRDKPVGQLWEKNI